MSGHFARLGGVILHPRATLRRVLFESEGNLWEILPWMIVVSAAAGPVRAGHAALIGRVDFIDGVRAFFVLLQDRTVAPLLGVIVAASVLHLLDRVRRPSGEVKVSFDAALDGCALTLVPYLIVTTFGVLLAYLGLDVWFLPHRPLAGRGVYILARFLAAYGWSIALFLLMLVEVFRESRSGSAGG